MPTTMDKISRTLWVGALLLVVLSGCRVGDDSQLEARRCTRDQDCTGELRCEDGWCQEPLSTDAGDLPNDPAVDLDFGLDPAPDGDASPSDTSDPDVGEEADTGGLCAFGAGCQTGETCQDGLCCDGGACSSPMVEVLGMSFLMGCTTTSDPDCQPYEQPEHEVDVPSFEIDVTEVSNAQYAQFLNDQGNLCSGIECVDADDADLLITYSGGTWRPETDADALPVVEVTWYGADAYCTWAGKRLCTEAEWELAARGPDHHLYPWGDTAPTCSQARIQGCPGEVEPIGTRVEGRSEDGVFDLAANVREWVEDDSHDDYIGAPVDGSAWIDEPRADYRIVRGGDAESVALETRAAFREKYSRIDGYGLRGFRCCR